eukprot:6573372-Prymnesium_polylepis.1
MQPSDAHPIVRSVEQSASLSVAATTPHPDDDGPHGACVAPDDAAWSAEVVVAKAAGAATAAVAATATAAATAGSSLCDTRAAVAVACILERHHAEGRIHPEALCGTLLD